MSNETTDAQVMEALPRLLMILGACSEAIEIVRRTSTLFELYERACDPGATLGPITRMIGWFAMRVDYAPTGYEWKGGCLLRPGHERAYPFDPGRRYVVRWRDEHELLPYPKIREATVRAMRERGLL